MGINNNAHELRSSVKNKKMKSFDDINSVELYEIDAGLQALMDTVQRFQIQPSGSSSMPQSHRVYLQVKK
jgi:hypothetical protein